MERKNATKQMAEKEKMLGLFFGFTWQGKKATNNPHNDHYSRSIPKPKLSFLGGIRFLIPNPKNPNVQTYFLAYSTLSVHGYKATKWNRVFDERLNKCKVRREVPFQGASDFQAVNFWHIKCLMWLHHHQINTRT